MRRTSIMPLGVAMILSLAATTRAQQPAVSDIAICNQEAARAEAPSALPGPGRRSPGVDAPRPRIDGGGEKTDPSGTIVTDSADPLVKGMDAGKLRDPGYRAAYRECMARRTGRGF
jgi:hypothetical protein